MFPPGHLLPDDRCMDFIYLPDVKQWEELGRRGVSGVHYLWRRTSDGIESEFYFFCWVESKNEKKSTVVPPV